MTTTRASEHTEVSFCRGPGESGKDFRVSVEKRDGSRFAVRDAWPSFDAARMDARAMANDAFALIRVEEIDNQ